MYSTDITTMSQRQGFGDREVRISRELLKDCIEISPIVAEEWNIYELDRVDNLLQEAARALSAYPAGTRSACFQYLRIPPEINLPIAICVEAFVIERNAGDSYLLLAQRGETQVAFAA